jgi:type VI secretion system secreted protein Hcp
MAFDAFIKFDGIEGESTDSQHAGWIEILNFDLDIGQRVSSTASTAGGATVERADFSEFNFSKLLDRATPKLTLACAAGTHFDKILIEICRAGQSKLKFMAYTLSNCMISSISTSSNAGEFPIDDIAINFGRIQWCYTQQSRPGGSAIGNIATGWSLEKNCRA